MSKDCNFSLDIAEVKTIKSVGLISVQHKSILMDIYDAFAVGNIAE